MEMFYVTNEETTPSRSISHKQRLFSLSFSLLSSLSSVFSFKLSAVLSHSALKKKLNSLKVGCTKLSFVPIPFRCVDHVVTFFACPCPLPKTFCNRDNVAFAIFAACKLLFLYIKQFHFIIFLVIITFFFYYFFAGLYKLLSRMLLWPLGYYEIDKEKRTMEDKRKIKGL